MANLLPHEDAGSPSGVVSSGDGLHGVHWITPEVWATRSRDDILQWRRRAEPRLHDQRCGDRSQTPQHVVDMEGGWTHVQQRSALRLGPAPADARLDWAR